jgi:hypothetical protein
MTITPAQTPQTPGLSPYGAGESAHEPPPIPEPSAPPIVARRRLHPAVIVSIVLGGLLVLALVAVAAFAAIAVTADTDRSSARSGDTAGSEEGALPDDSTGDYGEPAPAEEPPGEADVVPIGDPAGVEFEDGLAVQVVSVKRFRISEVAAGGQPGDVGALVTVKVTNGSAASVDISATELVVRAGTDQIECEQVFDEGVGDGFTGPLPAGKSASATFGYAIPTTALGPVSVGVTPAYDYESANFEGTFH